MNDKTKISYSTSRRSFIKKSAVVAAVAATGPAIISSRALAASREVKILAWVDYVNDDMIKGFEETTGITVNLTTFGSSIWLALRTMKPSKKPRRLEAKAGM